MNFICIFCGTPIEEESNEMVSFVATSRPGMEDEINQQFYCHLDCFKNACSLKEYIYLD